MKFSKRFRVPCPDGFGVVPLPSTWRQGIGKFHALQPPVFKLKVNRELSTERFIEDLTEQISNLKEVKNVSMLHLSKVASNEFAVGINLSDEELKILHESVKKFSSGSTYDISAEHIFIFQRLPVKTKV